LFSGIKDTAASDGADCTALADGADIKYESVGEEREKLYARQPKWNNREKKRAMGEKISMYLHRVLSSFKKVFFFFAYSFFYFFIHMCTQLLKNMVCVYIVKKIDA
jgi:hypothetical protein